jgi:hypothetical protein
MDIFFILMVIFFFLLSFGLIQFFDGLMKGES